MQRGASYMKHIKRFSPLFIIPALAVLLAVASLVYAYRPYSRDSMSRCTAFVKSSDVLCVSADGCRTVYFSNTDGASMQGLSFSRSEAETSSVFTAVWVNDNPFYPSSRGKLIAPDFHSSLFISADSINSNLHAVVDSTLADIDDTFVFLEKKQKEFAYYLERHDVKDEGFNNIASLNADNDRYMEALSEIRTELVKIKNSSNASAKAVQTFRVYTSMNEKDSLASQLCTYESSDGVSMSLRTLVDAPMSGAVSISLPPFDIVFPDSGDVVFLSGYYSVPRTDEPFSSVLASARVISQGCVDFPQFGMTDFSPVFTSTGFFAGFLISDSIVGCRGCK